MDKCQFPGLPSNKATVYWSLDMERVKGFGCEVRWVLLFFFPLLLDCSLQGLGWGHEVGDGFGLISIYLNGSLIFVS